jgi:hypothetical protein
MSTFSSAGGNFQKQPCEGAEAEPEELLPLCPRRKVFGL